MKLDGLVVHVIKGAHSVVARLAIGRWMYARDILPSDVEFSNGS